MEQCVRTRCCWSGEDEDVFTPLRWAQRLDQSVDEVLRRLTLAAGVLIVANIAMQRKEWRTMWPWMLTPILALMFYGSTKFTEATGYSPVMMPGMTPSTVDPEIVAAAANAGHWAELAGGGQTTNALRSRLARGVPLASPSCAPAKRWWSGHRQRAPPSDQRLLLQPRFLGRRWKGSCRSA